MLCLCFLSSMVRRLLVCGAVGWVPLGFLGFLGLGESVVSVRVFCTMTVVQLSPCTYYCLLLWSGCNGSHGMLLLSENAGEDVRSG